MLFQVYYYTVISLSLEYCP